MQLARNWGKLETKTADSANLSIDAALKLLNAPDNDPITGDLLFDPAMPGVYHDRINAQLLPATPPLAVSAATVAAMLAELPQADQRAVLDNAAAGGGLKVCLLYTSRCV